jgi:hypothetical protein
MITEIIAECAMQSGIVRTQRGARVAEIRNAEKVLGVTFPPVYVEVLKKFGVVRVYDRWMTGLGPYSRPLGRSRADVIRLTQMARYFVGLPPYLVAVSDSRHHDYTCLDTRKIRNGDCPIVYLDLEMVDAGKRRPKRIALSLAAWFPEFVQRQVAVKELLDREMSGVLTHMGDIRSGKAIRAWKRRQKGAQ